jgi:large subunit ribosomal protein L21
MAGYAIIKVGGKQFFVREGERLLVDRLDLAEDKTFHPEVLFEGGDGKAELSPKGQLVTAKVVGHVLGEKIRIGKYRRRTGYRRHTGHRSKLTQIQIEAIGAKRSTAAKKQEPAAEKPKRTRSATTSSRTRTTKPKKDA